MLNAAVLQSAFHFIVCWFVFIAGTLAPLTENFMIGFGSFTDKPRRPFVREAINGSIFFKGQSTFRHVVNLTFDRQQFSVS